jgi:hypothetical protein
VPSLLANCSCRDHWLGAGQLVLLDDIIPVKAANYVVALLSRLLFFTSGGFLTFGPRPVILFI